MTAYPEEPDQTFCRQILEVRIRALLQELVLLKGKMRKRSIHDTRVQSRRMRAALEAFEDLFPPRPWKSLYTRVRRITKGLGKVRQTEVMLALLKKSTNRGDMADNLCREYLQERIEEELGKRKKRMTKELLAMDADRLRDQSGALLARLASEPTDALRFESGGRRTRALARGRSAGQARSSAVQPTLFRLRENTFERGQRLLEDLSRPVLAFRPRYDFTRATDEQLHELRIAAKKLRYAMEIFDSIWPKGLQNEIGTARALQDAGGNYHDWCVLRDRVDEEIRRLSKQRTAHMAFQMGRLLALIEDRRSELRKKTLPALMALQVALQSLLVGTKAASTRSRVSNAGVVK